MKTCWENETLYITKNAAHSAMGLVVESWVSANPGLKSLGKKF